MAVLACRLMSPGVLAAALLLAWAAVQIAPASAEMFSALVHLENALQAELDLARDLRNYVKREEDRLQEILRLSYSFEEHALKTKPKNLELFLSNPVTAYRTIRDLYDGVGNVRKLMTLASERVQDFSNTSALTTEWLPDEEDVTGAINAMLRLQDTYEIPTHQLVDGHFLANDVSYQATGEALPTLSEVDCIDIGKSAYGSGDFYHAVLWLQEALDRLPAGTPDSQKVDVLDYLAFALYKQGNVARALQASEAILAMQPDFSRIAVNKNNFIEELSQAGNSLGGNLPPLKLQRLRDGYEVDADYLRYEQLCRGEDVAPIPDAHLLRCFYWTNGGHPLLTYAPAKLEVLYPDPRVVFFHDFLTDEEIAVIKNLSIPKLHRSGVFSKPGDSGVRNYRTSKSAWIDDKSHVVVARYSRKVSAAAGLSLSTVEELQVLNYGIGGHYSPHYDFSGHADPGFGEEVGNRIATWLSYVSPVSLGGATVFTKLGVTVWPEKAGALMWYNLHEDGSRDMRTLHAACPVLSGYKWVANKWFHERGNEFHRPCIATELD